MEQTEGRRNLFVRNDESLRNFALKGIELVGLLHCHICAEIGVGVLVAV